MINNSSNIKRTRGREEILNFLGKQKYPVDVLDISNYLLSQNFSLNQATIYRILDVFTEKGVIKKLQLQEGKFRYELRKDDHHHLVCQNCGRIEDISDCSISKLEKEIRRKKKFIVKSHILEFFGVCKKCQS